MRILVDARHLNTSQPSGIGEYTLRLVSALLTIDRTNQYFFLTTGLRQPDLSCLQPGRQIHRALPNKLINSAVALSREPTLEEIAGQSFDLFFLPNLNFISVPADKPAILTLHDLSFRLFPNFYSRRMQLWHRAVQPGRLIRRADHIICPSQSTKNDLSWLYQKPEAQTTVIPHGCGPEFHPQPQSADQALRQTYNLPDRFALFLGTLEPRKNLLTVLQGLREYRSLSRDDLPLVIAGQPGWKSKKFQQTVKEPEYRSWVRLLDYVPAADRPGLLRLASVFLWPSIYEGFGLPVLEALACGLPVITSHTSSLPEVSGGQALLIDPFNSRDLARALSELFAAPPLARSLAQSGPRQAQKFSWPQAAEQTLAVFNKYG